MPKKKIEKAEESAAEIPKKEAKKLSQEEYEKEVLKFADSGLTAEKIGEALRKNGIHPKEFSRKISVILGKKYVNPDLKNAETKLQKIEEHFQKNRQDKRAMREKERIVSRIRKIRQHLKVN